MATNQAAQEINRIERELDAAGQPSVKPPKSRSGKGGNGDNGEEPPKHHHLDAVIVGAVLLAGIGLTFWVGKNCPLGRRYNSVQGRSEELLAF